MSAENNPYAPPAATGDDGIALRQWQLDGASILARNRAVLPKVDLETGEHDLPVAPVHLASASKAPVAAIASGLLTAGFVFFALFLDANAVSVFIAVLAIIAGLRLAALRTGNEGRMVAWAFFSETRAKGLKRRRKIRSRLLLGCALGYLWLTLTDFGNASPVLLPAFFLGIIAHMVWGIIDRPKVRAITVDRNWLRISPIHPRALGFLHAEQDRISAAETTGRKRLVRTTWLYRYPLRLLIGPSRNPLVLLNITLMKFLRSKLLVRESYHYSEAEKRQAADLSPPLRIAVETWLDNHPDWQFADAEHLTSPAGDLIVESATLATAGLGHTLAITRAWMEQAAGRAVNQHHFGWTRGK